MTVLGNDGIIRTPELGLKDLLTPAAQLPCPKQIIDAGREQLYGSLLNIAREASQKSYSPYSHFPVGAALLTRDGRIFSGCNVENASYGGTICAERTAIVKAVSEGFTDFEAIAVFCQKAKDAWPCGFCRQFISEFGAEIEIVTEGLDGRMQVMKIAELLPRMFGPGALGR